KAMWQPTIDYLNQAIPDHEFKMVLLKLHETHNAVSTNQIDFIATNPGNYVELEARYGASRVATLIKLRDGIPSTRFGAVIFTRADNSSINNLYDLRGKSFMAVKESAFGGFQMAWLELKQRGIDPFKDFTSLSFSGFPQDKVVYAVRDRTVQAGTVRTDTLERLAREGIIKLSDFKILNPQENPGFPFAHSTPLYPEWPFVKLAHTPEQLAKRVTVALLNITPRSKPAVALQSTGWTVPLDYYPVRNLMHELRIGPFADYQPTTIWGYMSHYWWLMILISMAFSPPLLAYIKRLQHRVQESLALARTEAEWNHALDFLDEPFCMVGLDDCLIRANKAYYDIIGKSAAEAIGEKVSKFLHPSIQHEHDCKLCQARAERKDTIITMEEDDPANITGHPIEISINVIHNARGNPMAIIQGMRDLTHIRNAETALRQNEARLRALIGATPDPLLIIDTQGIITMGNRVFYQRFGYKQEDIIGKKVEMLIPAELHTKHIRLREGYMQNPEARPKANTFELFCLNKHGEKIPVEISLSPVPDLEN
ncbi:MAG: PhnD/SsuA/transferrin family substrate-binding protein, partial [Gammaproteobacteria bacterium]|nr:PhnD/SsuA/transferrin family substrate-binding protein [Gammaproteobacteria bacterium]